MLGSFWGLIPAIVTVVLVFGRTYLEDTTLQHELAGYREYMKTVRYRLIPFIW
jgi:protein-S-isoprenylcysteine O-methyltransferase Ste14